MRLLLTAAFSAFFQVVNTRHQRMSADEATIDLQEDAITPSDQCL